ncbi:glutamate receptor ionotropic, delta-2-like isoform X3 [Cherax quadricarinatus]|uniref:glutamate receptor ionotropic, delta-2-like isoform X3 n=1 Tax=Cherax quadricarinatus TaxID=27406 RepID=UPI00387ED48F
MSVGRRMVSMATAVLSSAHILSLGVGGPLEQVGVDVGGPMEQVGVNVGGPGKQVDVMVEQVGVIVRQVVEHHLTSCHLVFITTSQHSPLTSAILSLLEASNLWKLSETVAVVVGGRVSVKEVLLHHSLRNTVNALYLALHDLTLHLNVAPRHYRTRFYNILTPEDQFHNFMGHKMRFGTIRFFPYSDYTTQTAEDTLLTLKDCLNTRLLSTFSSAYNFSMEILEAPDRNWGYKIDGKYNGFLGMLQRDEIDFGGPVGPAVERMKVMEEASAYGAEIVCLVSRNPSPLPKYLSVISPFTASLWLMLLVSSVMLSLIQWLLHKKWIWLTGVHGVNLSSVILYNWGAILNHPPKDPSISNSGRVLVGVWLVFCLVITTGYSSSLIAHLTVQSKSKPPETLEDLVSLNNWRWGIESWMMKGSPGIYFSTHADPVVKMIYKKMEVVSAEEALSKVKEGRYTLISAKYYITVIIRSFYTDIYGQTPYYITYSGINFVADNGWGFRKGAPYRRHFQRLLLQLKGSGITEQWLKEVITRRVKENRASVVLHTHRPQGYTPNDEEPEVLRLYQLQGAFYFLFLGYFTASLVLLGENTDSFLNIFQ